MTQSKLNPFWETRYGAEGYAYGTAPNDFLVQVTDQLPAGRGLCLASGEGRNAVYLSSLAQMTDVVAVDGAQAGTDKTKQLAAQHDVAVNAICADLTSFDLGTSQFAVITSIFAHMLVPIREDLHRRVVHALKPGGVFVLEAYTPQQVGRGTGGPPTPELTMSLDVLTRELEGLHFVIGQELEREIHEGLFHNGLSHVVQVLAMKPC